MLRGLATRRQTRRTRWSLRQECQQACHRTVEVEKLGSLGIGRDGAKCFRRASRVFGTGKCVVESKVLIRRQIDPRADNEVDGWNPIREDKRGKSEDAGVWRFAGKDLSVLDDPQNTLAHIFA